MSSSKLLCTANECCVVVIDPQERLAAAMPPKVVDRLRRNICLLLRVAAELRVPVLATCQYPAGLGPIIPEINNLLPMDTTTTEKTEFSCAAVPAFMERLKVLERRQLVICGMEAHVCVMQTTFDLSEQGYECFVVSDATCSISRESYENALHRVRHADHAITDTESVVFEWLRGKEHPAFKVISQLLRDSH